MIRLAVGFVLSLMFTNWALSEFQYFSPSIGSSLQKTVNTIAFPRHDRWGEIVTASNAGDLGETVERGYERFTFHKTLKGMFSYLKPGRYFSRDLDEEDGASDYAEGSIFEPLFTTFASSDGKVFTSLFTDLKDRDQLVRF